MVCFHKQPGSKNPSDQEDETTDKNRIYIKLSLTVHRTDKKVARPAEKGDVLVRLVANRILTQGQADTIRVKLEEIAVQQRQQQISDTLDVLVEKGQLLRNRLIKLWNSLKRLKRNGRHYLQRPRI